MSVPFFAKSNGDWIRSTPAWDGETLFVAGMRDVLVALDGKTGEVRWRLDFVKELGTPLPQFGFVCSPLVDGDAVYVQAGASVAKVDKKAGKVLWRALKDDGGMWGSAFSSPVIATLAGERQLVVQTRQDLAGVELATGKVLWSTPVEAFRGMNILTPLPVSSNRVFTSTYGGKTVGFDITRQDTGFAVKPAWTFKAQGNMTSPVLVGSDVYLLLRNQRGLCIDAVTGQERWTTSEGYGKYWSLVGNGDRLLALDDRGLLLLIQANPAKLEILDQRKVGDNTWAHLAVAGPEVYIRELNALVAYDWRRPTESAGK